MTDPKKDTPEIDDADEATQVSESYPPMRDVASSSSHDLDEPEESSLPEEEATRFDPMFQGDFAPEDLPTEHEREEQATALEGAALRVDQVEPEATTVGRDEEDDLDEPTAMYDAAEEIET